jgi:hypothetical protein
MNLKKKKPPIKEQMATSVASGYFLYIIARQVPSSIKQIMAYTNPSETPNLLANPPNAVRDTIHTIDDR